MGRAAAQATFWREKTWLRPSLNMPSIPIWQRRVLLRCMADSNAPTVWWCQASHRWGSSTRTQSHMRWHLPAVFTHHTAHSFGVIRASLTHKVSVCPEEKWLLSPPLQERWQTHTDRHLWLSERKEAAECRPTVLSVATHFPSYISPWTCGRCLIAQSRNISCSFIPQRAQMETFSLAFLQNWVSSSDLKVPEKEHLMMRGSINPNTQNWSDWKAFNRRVLNTLSRLNIEISNNMLNK